MSTSLGPFPVEADPDEVEAFRRATRLETVGDLLPLTYPIRWLVAPQVRAALQAQVPELDLVLVHESQTFAYQRSLRAGVTYKLSLAVRRETGPDRLLADGAIVDAHGETCATVETILRLFSTRATAA